VTFGSGPEDIDTGELASDILAALASLGADADTDEAWSAGYDEARLSPGLPLHRRRRMNARVAGLLIIAGTIVVTGTVIGAAILWLVGR
jgi:hypothetical protein